MLVYIFGFSYALNRRNDLRTHVVKRGNGIYSILRLVTRDAYKPFSKAKHQLKLRLKHQLKLRFSYEEHKFSHMIIFLSIDRV